MADQRFKCKRAKCPRYVVFKYAPVTGLSGPIEYLTVDAYLTCADGHTYKYPVRRRK